jgi:GntR family transcriptional regulator, transcriptional repressor for pyruvate dehydrogenase complex
MRGQPADRHQPVARRERQVEDADVMTKSPGEVDPDDYTNDPAKLNAVWSARNVQYMRPRLAEMIAGELRENILSGVYADGDSLPKQEDLMELFGVSPPSIREALRVLETEGLVTVKRGNVGGAIVHAPRAGKVGYMIGLVLQNRGVPIRDVSEALSYFDPTCAARCATLPNRRKTVVPLLRANLRESKKVLEEPLLYTPIARSFHEIMVNNCGSETMSLVVGALESLWTGHIQLLTGRTRNTTPRTTTLEARQASYVEHEEILDLIVRGDAENVEKLARHHLTERGDLAYPFSVETVISAAATRDAHV